MVLFSRIIYFQPLCSICIVKVSFSYIDDKLPAKTVKITPLENLHAYSRFNIGKSVRHTYIYIYIYIYMYKLYHTMRGISLLLHDAEAKPRQSVNNNDVPQV